MYLIISVLDEWVASLAPQSTGSFPTKGTVVEKVDEKWLI